MSECARARFWGGWEGGEEGGEEGAHCGWCSAWAWCFWAAVALGSQIWVSVFSPAVRPFWATSQKPITPDLRPRALRSSSRVGGTSGHKQRAPSLEPKFFVRYPQKECGQRRQPLQEHHWRCFPRVLFPLLCTCGHARH